MERNFFSKSLKVVNLLYKLYQMVLFLENVFALMMRFGKVGKIRTYEKAVFYQKNVFIFLKAFFTKMGRRKICRWQRTTVLMHKPRTAQFGTASTALKYPMVSFFSGIFGLFCRNILCNRVFIRKIEYHIHIQRKTSIQKFFHTV